MPIRTGNARLMLRTGVAGQTSEVLLKRLRIAADKITTADIDSGMVIQALHRQLVGQLPQGGLQFDGRSQYVSIPSIRYDGSHPITLEAYITPDAFRNVAVGDTQQSGIGLGIPSQRYNMHAWNGTKYDRAVADGTAARHFRVHLAGTFDGETIRVFVNGVLKQTTRLNGTFRG